MKWFTGEMGAFFQIGRMLPKLAGFLIVSGLGGCLEDPKGKQDKASHVLSKNTLGSPIISQKLHALGEAENASREMEKEEDPPQWEEEHTLGQPEVDFSNSEDVFLPFDVAKAQKKRARSLHRRKRLSVIEIPRGGKPMPVDPDYKTHLPSMGEDVSTFPVVSDRVITADRYIPIVLENSSNSQLGGRFIGIVDEHVFSNQGAKIILPKGSRLICSYESLTGEGSSRLSATCTRVLRPDGVSLLLTDAYVADQMGRKGIPGALDHRLWDKYGAAFMLAGLSSLAAAGSRNGLPAPIQQSTGLLGMQTAQMTAQTLKETITIAPVMSVASGSRLLVIPMNDIWMRAVEKVPSDGTPE